MYTVGLLGQLKNPCLVPSLFGFMPFGLIQGYYQLILVPDTETFSRKCFNKTIITNTTNNYWTKHRRRT
jgi:hypothetical protein